MASCHYGKGRTMGYIMLESIFVPDARAKRFNQIIVDTCGRYVPNSPSILYRR